MERAVIFIVSLAIGWAAASWLQDAELKRLATRLALAQGKAAAAGEWETATLDLQARLAACQAQWTNLQQAGVAAVASARHERDRIAAERDHWRDRWERGRDNCRSVAALLDAACTEFEDY